MQLSNALSGVFYSESSSNIVPLPPMQKVVGWEWVEPWMCSRYTDCTLKHYLGTWARLARFFKEVGVQSPAALTREHCFQYLKWRTGVKRNTIIWELRVLSVICMEAIARGIIEFNPSLQLKIKRTSPMEKPELAPSLMDAILAKIEAMKRTRHKDFYRMSFLIGRYHGVRLSETRVPLADVDLANNTITFRMKGDRRNTVPIHPALRPVLEKLKAAGKAWTFDEPSDRFGMSELWHRFFARKGLAAQVPGICFHCLRVSCISQLARANVSQAKAMRFVNHSSAAVHKVYTRIQLSDLNDCLDALK